MFKSWLVHVLLHLHMHEHSFQPTARDPGQPAVKRILCLSISQQVAAVCVSINTSCSHRVLSYAETAGFVGLPRGYCIVLLRAVWHPSAPAGKRIHLTRIPDATAPMNANANRVISSVRPVRAMKSLSNCNSGIMLLLRLNKAFILALFER
eukprot:GHUV01022220.1.p1 GENE.GHUV01022220.1~~GHUV01022220.1.p1  ORF type:complete len:151 (-),score=16.57 GHUV01022220.1:1277-1729(-)